MAGTAMLPAGAAAARSVAGQASGGFWGVAPLGQHSGGLWGVVPPGQYSASGPTIKLIATQRAITIRSAGDRVYIDPDVYVAALGSPLRFDVERASYADPRTITQVISLPGGGHALRRLPSYAIDGWQGLRRFLRMTIVNSRGKVAGSRIITFCPNSYDPQRVSPDSPPNPLFPQSCFSSNPFIKGMVWGLQRGWATDPLAGGSIIVPPPIGDGAGGGGPSSGTAGSSVGSSPGASAAGGGNTFRLRPGKYTVTLNVTLMWRRLLYISPADGTASVKVTVKKGGTCIDICPPEPGARRAAALPRLPDVPLLANPPRAALPDMVPLPSWGIGVTNTRATRRHPANSVLTFGATVAIEGNSRLDVEGFRVPGSSLLQAYQYFWENGRVIGRARAGTMGFESGWGTKEWHFQQFAQYRLLTASKSVAVRSRKVGFCIAPTDAIDLTLPHATWIPNESGPGGECGSANALWVQETLPLGWADTYVQSFGEQAFDITHVPDGTYYIEIIANPEHLLYETDYANDISLRKVIIGGTPGHRTVRVPAYDGIDPER